jgi:hypothetical protein
MMRMGKTILMLGLACLLSAGSGSSEEKPCWPWGPLTREDALPLLDLEPVKWKEIVKKTDFPLSEISRWRALAGDGDTELLLTRDGEGYFAEVRRVGKRLMPTTACTSFFPFFDNMHHCGNLNDDDQIDFLLSFYCGGNGLNAYYNDIVLILSSPQGYRVTRIGSFGGDHDRNFVRIGGKPHFIMESFGGKEKCLDGKTHNFWIYNLFEIKDDSLFLANQNHPNFPRTIWYTFEPNSKETDMLARKQKEDLLRQSVDQLALIGNRVPHSPEVADPEPQ